MKLKSLKTAIMLLFASLLFASSACGEEDAGCKDITAPEVKQMLDNNQAVVVNVLSGIEYEMQHITGSINIPGSKIRTTDKLPADKNMPVIFYCMGKQWPVSPTAARIAAEIGYANAYCFRGGIPEWRNFDYPMTVNDAYQSIHVPFLEPKAVEEILKKEKDTIFLLDVRPNEIKRLHDFIAGSSYCPMVDLLERYQEFPKDKKYILTDAYFKQSPLAGKFLIHKGIKVLGALRGGLQRWKEEGLPVEARERPNVESVEDM